MLFKSVVSTLVAALASSSLVQASPLPHLHHAHKRDVAYVTQTVVVTVGGTNTDLADAPAATQATIDNSSLEGTQTEYAYSVLQASTSSTEAAASTQETAAASSSAAVASTNSGFSAGSKGITYSPYNSDGTCKDLAAVKADFASIDDYSLIRLYGVDCNQVENVLQAKASGQKLFLGIYFMDQISAGCDQLINAVKTYGSWDDVYTISIGNELVNSGEATPAQVGSYIATAKPILTAGGYSGPIVSVDTHVAIINNPELCEHSDYMAFNAHAYWDGSVGASDAGPWLLLQMQRVWTACNGKSTFCTESGWPHAGDANGVAIPSEENMKAAISSIDATCGDSTIVFSAFDDMWKNPGSKGVEQYWGIY